MSKILFEYIINSEPKQLPVEWRIQPITKKSLNFEETDEDKEWIYIVLGSEYIIVSWWLEYFQGEVQSYFS